VKQYLKPLVIAIILLTLLSVNYVATIPEKNCLQSKSIMLTDWVVTTPEYLYNTTIFLTGNLIVEDGPLILNHVTLLINSTYPGEFEIWVKAGATLAIINGSKIDAVNPPHPYRFYVGPLAYFNLTDSEVHHCGFPSTEYTDWGLISFSHKSVIRDSILSNNYIGLIISSKDTNGYEVTIEGNIIANNTLDGVRTGIFFQVFPTLLNNRIVNNGGDGVMNSVFTVLRGNVIAWNRFGINATDICWATNNTIAYNKRSGIFLDWVENAIIEKNVIAYNNESGVESAGWCSNSISYNNIFGNGLWGVYGPDNLVDASNNWWGSESGPEVTHSPDTIDPEEVNGTLLYEPWLTKPYPCGVPPRIELLCPLEGDTISGIITISTQIEAVIKVVRTDFFVDGIWIGTDFSPPNDWVWNSLLVPDGAHTLSVIATDSLGVQGKTQLIVNVDNRILRSVSVFFVGLAVVLCITVVISIYKKRRLKKGKN